MRLPLHAKAAGMALALGACAMPAADLQGRYGGEHCLYALDFRSKGVVYISTLGMEHEGAYSVDGKRVSITMPNTAGIVFTRDGDTLQTKLLGAEVRCVKL